MSKKKTVFNLLFLVIVFGLTMYLVFRGKDIGDIISTAREADGKYLLLSIVCVVLFILGESVIIFYMMKTLGASVKMRTVFLCGLFLQLYYAVCLRRTAYADLLYEKG